MLGDVGDCRPQSPGATLHGRDWVGGVKGGTGGCQARLGEAGPAAALGRAQEWPRP